MRNEIFFASNICAKAERGADLKNLTISLFEGEILGIFGNRYAGKNALFHVVNGSLPISSGVIVWNGGSGEPRPATIKIDKFSRLIDAMQIWENVALLWEENVPWSILDSRRIHGMIRFYFLDFDISLDLNKKAGTLSQIEKLMVEILIALRQKKKILLIDMAGMEGTAQEYTRLKMLLLRVKTEGVSVMVFGHQMEIVSYLADRIAVIYNGQIVKLLEADEISTRTITDIKNAFYPVEKRERPKPVPHDACVLRVQNLEAGMLKPVAFELYRGEFVAVVSPQLEMFQALYDRMRTGIGAEACKVEYRGRDVRRLSEKDGVFFLNTRYLDQLIDEMTPLENLCLGITDKAGIAGIENKELANCIEQDFYEWYGHEGLLRHKNCSQLYMKDRIAINLFRLRFLKIDVLFCNALNAHNDLLTYQMVENALIAMTHAGTAVCIITNDFAYYDELVERYIVLGERKIKTGKGEKHETTVQA